jgi:hypothetical protein
MTIILAGALIGFLLGLRFRVLVLVPAVLVASVTIAGFGIARGDGLTDTLAAIVFAAVAMQLGYVVASIGFVRAERPSPAPKERPSPAALSDSAQLK